MLDFQGLKAVFAGPGAFEDWFCLLELAQAVSAGIRRRLILSKSGWLAWGRPRSDHPRENKGTRRILKGTRGK